LNEWRRKKVLNWTPNRIIRIFGFAFRKSWSSNLSRDAAVHQQKIDRQTFKKMLVQRLAEGRMKFRFQKCRTESPKILGSKVAFRRSAVWKNQSIRWLKKELRSGKQFFGSVERTAGM
jgi:hypothetical protein